MKTVIIAAAIHFHILTLSMGAGRAADEYNNNGLLRQQRSIIAQRLQKMSQFPFLKPERWTLVTEMKEENCLLVTRKF
jgi:hypothetical protein